MGGLSIWHILIVLIVLAIMIIPAARILRRAGYSPWLGLLYAVPLVSWVLLWVFAYSRWPNFDDKPTA